VPVGLHKAALDTITSTQITDKSCSKYFLYSSYSLSTFFFLFSEFLIFFSFSSIICFSFCYYSRKFSSKLYSYLASFYYSEFSLFLTLSLLHFPPFIYPPFPCFHFSSSFGLFILVLPFIAHSLYFNINENSFSFESQGP
jgi:hypothetical protein